jgi:serine/threonine-protein kinase
MALFYRKKDEHPVTMYQRETALCGGCQQEVAFAGREPLTAMPCPQCGAGVTVPHYLNGYWLFHPIGGGGMGMVYQAWHEEDMEQIFAIKILPRDQRENPTLIETLEREFGIISSLGEHPCIVNAVETGRSPDGELFLAMPYVEGERLDEKVKRAGRLPEREVVLIGLRILSGEAHIYNHGYLFRDLKPENVLVKPGEGATLFDYGICMTIEEAERDPGDIIQGSPIYFPPERLTGEGERANSEIYSLGMVLYHCLAGQPYFTSTEINTIARQHIRSTRLSDAKMQSISPYFAAVIEKMIRREPRERYQTFLEAERALYQILQVT